MGKLQRRGMKGVFGCHKIDLQEVNPFNVKLLSAYLTNDSEILPSKETGLCAKCQRQVCYQIYDVDDELMIDWVVL